MAGTDLGRRLGVAAVGIPFGVGVTYMGGWPLAGVVAVLAAMGAGEVYRLAEAKGVRPLHWLGVPASAILVLVAAWAGGVGDWSYLALWVVLVVGLGSLAVSIFVRVPEEDPLLAVSTTVFGVVYVGMTLSFALLLRAFPGVSEGEMGWAGAIILIFPLTVTWCGDSGAYFAGRRWGRRKLYPSVSPGKTVEGGIGGLLAAMAASVLFATLLLEPASGVSLSFVAAAVLGLIIGAVAQLADLAESLLKRDAGVKDSGVLLPGHGGVLDRFDAILFTLPLTYALLPLFLG